MVKSSFEFYPRGELLPWRGALNKIMHSRFVISVPSGRVIWTSGPIIWSSMDTDTLKLKFGRRVRSLRNLRDLTQEEFAEKADLSPEYVGKIERGGASPSFSVIAGLAGALDIRPVELFDFTELGEKES